MAYEGKADTLTDSQMEQFKEYLLDCPHSKRDMAIFALGTKAGLRIGTIALLEWSDVYTLDGEVRDVSSIASSKVKGNKPYRAYFTNPELKVVLAEHYKANKRDSKTIFVSQKGTSFTPNSLQRLMYNHFKRVGFQGNYSSHSMRRTFATNLIRSGVDIILLKNLMNHSNIATTAGYVYTDDVTLMSAVNNI